MQEKRLIVVAVFFSSFCQQVLPNTDATLFLIELTSDLQVLHLNESSKTS
jgi:hypothetical protein